MKQLPRRVEFSQDGQTATSCFVCCDAVHGTKISARNQCTTADRLLTLGDCPKLQKDARKQQFERHLRAGGAGRACTLRDCQSRTWAVMTKPTALRALSRLHSQHSHGPMLP